VAHSVKRSSPPTGGKVRRATLENLADIISQIAGEVAWSQKPYAPQELIETLRRWASTFAEEAAHDPAIFGDPEIYLVWTELAHLMSMAAVKTEELQLRYQHAADILSSDEAAKDPYLSFILALREIGKYQPSAQEAQPLIKRWLLAVLLRTPRPGDAAYAVRRSNALGYMDSFNPIAPATQNQLKGYRMALSYALDSFDALLQRARKDARRAAVTASINAVKLLLNDIFRPVPHEAIDALDRIKEAYLFQSSVNPRVLHYQGVAGKWVSRYIFLFGVLSWVKNLVIDFPVQTITTFLTAISKGERLTPKALGKMVLAALAPPKTPGDEQPTPGYTWADIAEDAARRVVTLNPQALANRISIYESGEADKPSLLEKLIEIISTGFLRDADRRGRAGLAFLYSYLILRGLKPAVVDSQTLASDDSDTQSRASSASIPVVLVGPEFNRYIATLLMGLGEWHTRLSAFPSPQGEHLIPNATAAALIALWGRDKTILPTGTTEESSVLPFEAIEMYLREKYGITYNSKLQKWVVPYQTFLDIVGDEVGRRIEMTVGTFSPGDYSKIERMFMNVPGGSLLIMLTRASLPIISYTIKTLAAAVAAAQIKWGQPSTRLLNKYVAATFAGFLGGLIFAGVRASPVLGYILLLYEALRSIIEEDKIDSAMERVKRTAQITWQTLYNIGVSPKVADVLTNIIHEGLLTTLTGVNLSRENVVSDIGDLAAVSITERVIRAVKNRDLVELLRASAGPRAVLQLIYESPRAGREGIIYPQLPFLQRFKEAVLPPSQFKHMLGVGRPAIFTPELRSHWVDWALNKIAPTTVYKNLELRKKLSEQLDAKKIAQLYMRYNHIRYDSDGIVGSLEEKFNEALEELRDNPRLKQMIVEFLQLVYPNSWAWVDWNANTIQQIRQALSPTWDAIALKLAFEQEAERWGVSLGKQVKRAVTSDGRKLAELLRQTARDYDAAHGTAYTRMLYSYISKMKKQGALEAYSALATLANQKKIPKELVLRFILATEIYFLAERSLKPGPNVPRRPQFGIETSPEHPLGMQTPKMRKGLTPEQRKLIRRSSEAAGAEGAFEE
jgi:hypothetical protein